MKHQFLQKREEQGLSLLEVGMALILMVAVIAGTTFYAINAMKKTAMRGEAQHLMTLTRAAQSYVQKNHGALLGPGGSLATPNVVKTVSIRDLQSDGDLPQSVTANFGNGQTAVVLLQQTTPGGASQPMVEGLVTTAGGTKFADDQVGQVVNLAGAAAGIISQHDMLHIDGAGGAWQQAIAEWSHAPAAAQPTAGHLMALVNGAAGSVNDGPWLSRTQFDTGAAPYVHNTMQTDINMNDTLTTLKSYSLLGASTVQANEFVGQNGAGSDINIGSLTTASNINIGNPSANSIDLQALNPTGPTTQVTLDNSGITLNTTNSSELTLPNGTSPSIWSANEQMINTRQTGGVMSTVFDSKAGGELDLSTPIPPAGGVSQMNLAAASDNSSINLNATGASGAINLTTAGVNGEINLNAQGDNSNIEVNANGSSSTLNLFASGDSGTINVGAQSGSGAQNAIINVNASGGGNNSLHLRAFGNNMYSGVLTTSSTFFTVYMQQKATSCPSYTTDGVTDHYCTMIATTSVGGTDARPKVYMGYDTTYRYENPVDLEVAGDIKANGDGTTLGNITATGTVSDGSGPLVSAAMRSDKRLKYNIVNIQDSLDKIEKLNGYTFQWKRDNSHDIGVIAQEVEKVFPSIVLTSKKDGIKSVVYPKLIAPLIEAVKTLHHLLNDAVAKFTQQIAALQQDDHTLQTQVKTLTEQNTVLKAELATQRLDVIELKHAMHQPLSADERTLCGAACAS